MTNVSTSKLAITKTGVGPTYKSVMLHKINHVATLVKLYYKI